MHIIAVSMVQVLTSYQHAVMEAAAFPWRIDIPALYKSLIAQSVSEPSAGPEGLSHAIALSLSQMLVGLPCQISPVPLHVLHRFRADAAEVKTFVRVPTLHVSTSQTLEYAEHKSLYACRIAFTSCTNSSMSDDILAFAEG